MMAAAQGQARPDLLSASGILFFFILAGNLCNYLFHALASRQLGPAEYGAFVSMLALLTILSIPSQAIQILVAKQVAAEQDSRQYGRMRVLVSGVLLHGLLLGGGVCLVLALSRGFWRDFFHLSGPGPVIGVGLAMVIMLAVPVRRGVLQGMEYFGHLGLNIFLDGSLRLLVGSVFFWIGWKTTGAVIAGAVSGLIVFFLAGIPLRVFWRASPAPGPEIAWGHFYRYGIPVLAAFGGYITLSSLDVIMVKHFFEPVQAGYYSAGSMVGKAFLFMPAAVAQVLFPKASAGYARDEGTRQLLQKSLALTFGLMGISILAAWFLAPVIIATLFGKNFLNPETLGLVKWFGVAVTPLALVYILMQYNLAVHNLRFIILMGLDILLLLGLLLCFHARITQVLGIVGLNHLLLLGSGYWLSLGRA